MNTGKNIIKPTGIILAGGKSSRMGHDKALTRLGDYSFLEIVFNTITPFCSEIIISTNNSDVKLEGVQSISDDVKDIGPLGGIYSCLKQSNTDKNFIVSVDTPFINQELLKYIYDKSGKNVVTICSHNSKFHPLIGVYSKEFITTIEKDIFSGKYKTIYSIQNVKHTIIEIGNNLNFYNQNLFLNINDPIDLKKARELYA